MKLRKLQLENFRNYKSYTYEFDPANDFTIIRGPNGQGKTNLLEAIYVLSLGKSFRTVQQEDLIMWGMDYFRAKGTVEVEDENQELEVFYTNYPTKKKNFKKNEANLKNTEYIGNLLTVLFQPEDLNILYLSPNLRRRYMDILLSQTDKSYLDALIHYNKALKQRNSLLNSIRKSRFSKQDDEELLKDLDAWDEELVKYGSIITEKRLVLVKFLAKELQKVYQSISGEKEKVDIAYISKVATKNSIQSLSIQSISKTPDYYEKLFDITTSYRAQLHENREKDIIQATSTRGPHRDDLLFYINEKEITASASRGEFRTLLLSIKLAEIDFIKQKTDESPLLLLDDVFSELDSTRQEKLLKAIRGCQTIIATTDTENIEDLADKSAVLTLEK